MCGLPLFQLSHPASPTPDPTPTPAGHEAAEHLAAQFTTALLNSPLLLNQPEEVDVQDLTNAAATRPPTLPLAPPLGRHHQPRHRRRDYSGALREALLKCEAELLDAEQAAGSTALLALMVDGHLFLANVGDCRAVVCDEAEVRAWGVEGSGQQMGNDRSQVKSAARWGWNCV